MADAGAAEHTVGERFGHILPMAKVEVLFEAEQATAALGDESREGAKFTFAGLEKTHELPRIARPVA